MSHPGWAAPWRIADSYWAKSLMNQTVPSPVAPVGPQQTERNSGASPIRTATLSHTSSQVERRTTSDNGATGRRGARAESTRGVMAWTGGIVQADRGPWLIAPGAWTEFARTSA